MANMADLAVRFAGCGAVQVSERAGRQHNDGEDHRDSEKTLSESLRQHLKL